MALFLKAYALGIAAFVLLDSIWFFLVAGSFFKRHLGGLLRLKDGNVELDLWGATLVYLLMPLGLVLFVMPKAQTSSLPAASLLYGFVYGVILYGVYEGTNWALLRNWPAQVVWLDILWGGFSCGIISLVMKSLLYRN